MSSYIKMIKEEAYDDENAETVHVKVEVGDTWFHQPVWSSQTSSEPTSDLIDQIEGMDELLRPSIQSCHVCKRRFLNRYNLLEHHISHLKVGIWKTNIYQCHECSVCYTNQDLLELHQIKTHLFKTNKTNVTKIMYTCEICSKMYSYKSWHHHMSTVHSKKSPKCTLCHKKFKSIQYLKKHLKYVHEGHKPFWRFRTAPKGVDLKTMNCTRCDKIFTHPYSLKIHMKNVHPHEGRQECDICGSVLKSASYLRAHKRRVHYNDGKKHYCSVCGKDYKSPRYAKVHMRNVHGLCLGSTEVITTNYKKTDASKINLDDVNVNDEARRIKLVLKKNVTTRKKKSWKVILDNDKKKKENVDLAKENVASDISDGCFKEEVLDQERKEVEKEFNGVVFGTNKFGNNVNENFNFNLNYYVGDYTKKEFKGPILDNPTSDTDNLEGLQIFKEEAAVKTDRLEKRLFIKILDNCLQFENT